ncbi:MAG TPA: glycerate kinase [bacterium]|nr:glycerate kinase [bacterium]
MKKNLKLNRRLKILIAPASFKGSMSNMKASAVMKKAAMTVFPEAKITEFPLADGGEGTLNVIRKITGATIKYSVVKDPLMRKRRAAWLKKRDTAFIEMAQAAGLILLKDREKNPMETTTYGVGELLGKAALSGARQIFLGVGGSATTDAGIGALTALGVKFHGENGSLIYPGAGKDLSAIFSIDSSSLLPEILKCRINVLSDVQNPLVGKKGAAFVYGPQKGAEARTVEILDQGLRNCARKMETVSGRHLSSMPGAGAAGGIIAGLASFLNVKVLSGIDTIMEMGMFEKRLKEADIVLTGEGRIDKQTFCGKSLGKVFALAEKHGVLTIAFAGSIDEAMCKKEFKKAVLTSILPGPMSLQEAMKNAQENLYTSTCRILSSYMTYQCSN